MLNMVLSPTLGYACGTWTLTNEHERIDTINKTEDASTHCTNKKKIQKRRWQATRKSERDNEKEKKAKRTPKAKHKKEAALTQIATKIADVSFAEDSDKED